MRTHGFLNKHFSGESIDYRQIIALFIPLLIDQAFIVGLNLVNTAMISSSGMAAVSAVNMIDSLNIFLINVFVAVSTGERLSWHSIRGAVTTSWSLKLHPAPFPPFPCWPYVSVCL